MTGTTTLTTIPAMNEYEQRFSGIRRLYGHVAADLITASHVCIIGVGGVGSWAAEALARTGVGHITLIDHDDIAASNSNRQIHTLSDTLEQSKVDTMARRIRQINPLCRVDAIDDFVTDANLSKHLDRQYDAVIDAIDSIKFKAAIIYYCKRNKIPVITTGGAGGLTDPTRIEIADLSRTWNDPLAAKVRATLRNRYGYSKNTKRSFGVPCVFSSEQQRYPKQDGSVGHQKPGVKGASLDCNFGFGSATFVTGTFGFAAAGWAINKCIAVKTAQPSETSD